MYVPPSFLLWSIGLFHLIPCFALTDPQSIPVNLGGATGKLTTGSHSLSTVLFQEDKKNKAWPGYCYFYLLIHCIYDELEFLFR
jgi:hypothetical protein